MDSDYFYVEDAEVYVYFDMDNQSWAWALYVDDAVETYSYGYSTRDEAAEEGEIQSREHLAQIGHSGQLEIIDDVASYAEEAK